jgi:hypothetical protein
MNEQLRKEIEEATKVFPWPVPMSMGGGDVLDINVHRALQAKLLRVIELLVEQRDKCISSSHLFRNEFEDVQAINEYDAELIAALKDNA